MEILGTINSRQILYCNVRTDEKWFEKLPAENWIVFTIADVDDEGLIKDVGVKCLDKKVLAMCSAGELASKAEDYFIDEIVLRNNKKEELGTLGDEDSSPMLTFHRNFSEGFWFAIYAANPSNGDQYFDIGKVVCIDMTRKVVRKYLKDLIEKFRDGAMPSDNDFEAPEYDQG